MESGAIVLRGRGLLGHCNGMFNNRALSVDMVVLAGNDGENGLRHHANQAAADTCEA